MISSSHFFKKTFFEAPQEDESAGRQLGPWIQPPPPTLFPAGPSFIKRTQLAEARAKSRRQSVPLPVVTSKLFEIGPLRPLKCDRYLIHDRRQENISVCPQAYRSLDLRPYDDKRLIRSLHHRLRLRQYPPESPPSKKKGFRVLGIPTTSLLP